MEVSYREDVVEEPEKLRVLAQRDRPTDLAMIRARIEETIARLGGQYDDAIRTVAPDAPAYELAAEAVLGRLASLLP